jgi:membrane carboxypeptidase/penicillin-binding protein PbpC
MQDITGISGAAPIWNSFLRRVLLGQPELSFQQPPGIVRTEVCALSGLLPTPACTLRKNELFIEGTVPTEYDNLYQTFEIDRDTGFLADGLTPPERRIEQSFVILPQEARDWGARNGIKPPPVGAPIASSDDDEDLRLLEPDPYTVFQLSPITPIETQRLRLTVGTPPGTQSVTYQMNGETLGTVTESPWVLWWTLELGQHELVATAQLQDGSQQISTPIPFSVVNYAPPEERVASQSP